MSLVACGRCLLRATPQCTYVTYKAAASGVTGNSHCLACLGILNYETYLDRLVHEIQQSRYQFASYKLQVAVPPSTLLRQAWLKRQVGSTACVDVKDVLKWGLSADLAQRLGKPFNAESRFVIKLNFTSEEADSDLHVLRRLIPGLLMHEGKSKRPATDEFSTKALLQGVQKLSPEDWEGVLKTYEPHNFSPELQIELSHMPVYIAGSYLKFSRKLSQSPWMIEGEDQPTGSIQELIGEPLKRVFDCASYSLHGSVSARQGREDVDVRMLGKGRPFVLSLVEAKNALNSPSDKELETLINSETRLIEVRELHQETESYYEQLKAGEEDKLKAYAAVVWTDKVLGVSDMALLQGLAAVEIKQKTPVRVLHRRSLLTRSRTILAMQAELVSEHMFILKLVSTAGTYIKEFVHGDLGRTKPSIGDLLGCKADIMQLDVLGLGWKVEELMDLIKSR